jgi:hypothetical protein
LKWNFTLPKKKLTFSENENKSSLVLKSSLAVSKKKTDGENLNFFLDSPWVGGSQNIMAQK